MTVTDGDPPAPHGSDLERGRDVIGRRTWDEAYQALARADAVETLSIDDAERLTTAAGLTGRDAEFLRRLEQTCQARTALARSWTGSPRRFPEILIAASERCRW